VAQPLAHTHETTKQKCFLRTLGSSLGQREALGTKGSEKQKKKKKPSHGSRTVDKNAKTIKNPDTAMHRGIVSVHAMDTHMNMSALQLTPVGMLSLLTHIYQVSDTLGLPASQLIGIAMPVNLQW